MKSCRFRGTYAGRTKHADCLAVTLVLEKVLWKLQVPGSGMVRALKLYTKC